MRGFIEEVVNVDVGDLPLGFSIFDINWLVRVRLRLLPCRRVQY